MGLLTRVLTGALLVTVLVACTAQEPGTPRMPRDGARALLGDLTTIDACGLTDPDVFAEFGEPDVSLGNSFSECIVSIDAKVSVFLGEIVWVGDRIDIVRTAPDGLRIGARNLGQDGCERLLMFDDDLGLLVNAWPLADEPSAPLCEIADAGVDHVAELVRSHRVPHHSYPADSLGQVDACALVRGNPLYDQPNFASLHRFQQPQKHSCRWLGDRTGDRNVQLELSAGLPRDDSSGTEPEEFAGRPSYVYRNSDQDSSWCEVSTAHIPYESKVTANAVEQIDVTATGSADTPEETCNAAFAVAKVAWRNLPS